MRKSSKHLRPVSDSYIALIREFPLRTIANDAEHAGAAAMVSKLIGRSLDAGEGEYLDALVVLVNKYGDEHHTREHNLSPRQALRALMDANELNQAEIGRIIGSESAVSMFLKGDRDLSKAQVKKLASRFRVDAALFL